MGDFPSIATQRLVLREVTNEDAPALLAIHGDPDLMRWFGSDPIPDMEAAGDLVQAFATWRRSGTGTRWGLQLTGRPGLIGTWRPVGPSVGGLGSASGPEAVHGPPSDAFACR